MLAILKSWGPFLGILIGALAAQLVMYRVTKTGSNRGGFIGQVIAILLVGLSLVALVTALPVGEEMRGQLLSLFGVVASGALALSSTTFLGNALAGLMLKALQNFRPGDFLRVGDHFGRVSARGLFRTELQTEDRDLTTLPNLYLVTNPVTVLRSSGTVISAQVSLGYDVPHHGVEKALLAAAEEAGLEENFVQIEELGDFSVVYRIAGLLRDVRKLISTRSKLRMCMLDALHTSGIEIMSPTFMSTRSAPEGVLPPERPSTDDTEERKSASSVESLAFDKAEVAARLEKLRDKREDVKQELEDTRQKQREASGDESSALKKRIEELERRGEVLEEEIEKREREQEEAEKKKS